jgi:S-adenosylmethionine:tRNA ribosyltransferase-isomerase
MQLKLEDFWYNLPEEKIAKYPLTERDASKLLYYSKGKTEHSFFTDIVKLLPKNTTLYFNNTKVIPARLLFVKDSGALIEIFLLNPEQPSKDIALTLSAKGHCAWTCMIGNQKRWKLGQQLTMALDINGCTFDLIASLFDKEKKIVTFEWNSDFSFAEIIEAAGKIPLPPYLNREMETEDKVNYQTIYSSIKGAVAAPTAGLHFTESILQQLTKNGIKEQYLTLHVSAGTFQPVKTPDNILEHAMHCEQMVLKKDNILALMENNQTIIPVGTTSLRTLESLYWWGVKLFKGETNNFFIEKLYPYQNDIELPTRMQSLNAILDFMNKNNLDEVKGETEILIVPGYQFRMCQGLVTNFHQPGSTLILLVAALIGENWREVYREALNNNYRFLSYGDSSLLMP